MAKKLSREEFLALGKKVYDLSFDSERQEEYEKLTKETPEAINAYFAYVTKIVFPEYRREVKETKKEIEGLKNTLQNTKVK